MTTEYPIGFDTAVPVPEISERVMLFNLARTWSPSLGNGDVFERTRGAWKCGDRCELAEFAFAVYKGFVLAVYQIDSWRPRRKPDLNWEDDRGQEKPRMVFECHHAPQSHPAMQHYVGKTIKPMLDARNIKQWSFLYVNC